MKLFEYIHVCLALRNKVRFKIIKNNKNFKHELNLYILLKRLAHLLIEFKMIFYCI